MPKEGRQDFLWAGKSEGFYSKYTHRGMKFPIGIFFFLLAYSIYKTTSSKSGTCVHVFTNTFTHVPSSLGHSQTGDAMNTSGNSKWMVAIVALSLQMGILASTCTAENLAIEPPTRGTLLIAGGGKLSPQVMAKFVDLAGGPNANILVVPTGSRSFSLKDEKENESILAPLRAAEAKNLHFLHAGSPEEANSEEFVALMRTSDAIWFTGGDQNILANIYGSTLMEKELIELLNRGGVVGGTSAGAAVMSKLMIAGDSDPKEGQGFRILMEVTVDQHFTQRGRQGRLRDCLTRNPEVVGIGLDEGAAIVFCLKTQTIKKVIGDSHVHVYRPNPVLEIGQESHALLQLEERSPPLELKRR